MLRSSVRFNAMDARACLTSLVPMESHDMSSPNDCVCSQNAEDYAWSQRSTPELPAIMC